MTAIDVVNATKLYRRYSRRRRFATLKSAILSGSLLRDLRPDETFLALDSVTFAVEPGQTFGIIGRNGSGKSTMLKLVAGISRPTSGQVEVNGRVSALIELGAGFHPEISGRENVFINGIMLGLSKREIAHRFEEIVAFAELEEFIDAPVKTYSSGMYMRLGFAVAIHVDPDILLVDEVLAVGDESFGHKCLDKFADFKRRGKTILLVTHSLGVVERFCDSALWLDRGRVRGLGDPRRVIDAYVTDVNKTEEQNLSIEEDKVVEAVSVPAAEAPDGTADEPPDMFRADAGRWGSREVEITKVSLLDREAEVRHIFTSGEPMTVRLSVHAPTTVSDFVFGIGLFNTEGTCCYGTNTDLDHFVPEALSGSGTVDFVIEHLDLIEGTYKLDVAVHRRDGPPYDYHRLLYTFMVRSRTKDIGIYRPPHRWQFSEHVRLRRAPAADAHEPS